jgi:hypothetical protein
MAPGGLSKGLNTPVTIEKLNDLGITTGPTNPTTGDPESSFKRKFLPPKYATPIVQPKDSTVNKNNKNKDIKNTQPTPLVQPQVKLKKDGTVQSTTAKDEPSLWDNITGWFKDTFGSGAKTAPVNKVDKSVLAPPLDGNKKVKPAYQVPPIAAPVDNGDGTVTWNGQVYDKDFDADKLKKDIKRVTAAPTDKVRKQVLPSIGSGQGGAVSGGKDKGKDGGALGGNIGTDIPWDGGVSGSSTKGKSIGSTDKPGDGTITGPEIGIKGQTGVGQGAVAIPKGYTAPVTKVKVEPLTRVIPNNIAIARTGPFPPGTMPPPIAQLPLAKQTRDYDPSKDKDIIYKGKEAPKKISKFKGTDSNPTRNKEYYSDLLKKFS